MLVPPTPFGGTMITSFPLTIAEAITVALLVIIIIKIYR